MKKMMDESVRNRLTLKLMKEEWRKRKEILVVILLGTTDALKWGDEGNGS